MVFPGFLFPSSLAVIALNRLLHQQAWARDYLRPYTGKVVRVQVAGGWALALRVQADGLTQASSAAEPADVVLTLAQHNPGEVFEALRKHEPERLAALIHMEGEAALAQALLALAQNLRWDVEDELAQVLGDRAALTLIGALKEAGQGVRQAGKNLAENVAEYLSHENPLLVARPVFEDWAVQVQALLQRLGKLETALGETTLTASALTLQREPQSC